MSQYFTPELAYKAYVADILLMHTDIDVGLQSSQQPGVGHHVGGWGRSLLSRSGGYRRPLYTQRLENTLESR